MFLKQSISTRLIFIYLNSIVYINASSARFIRLDFAVRAIDLEALYNWTAAIPQQTQRELRAYRWSAI